MATKAVRTYAQNYGGSQESWCVEGRSEKASPIEKCERERETQKSPKGLAIYKYHSLRVIVVWGW